MYDLFLPHSHGARQHLPPTLGAKRATTDFPIPLTTRVGDLQCKFGNQNPSTLDLEFGVTEKKGQGQKRIGVVKAAKAQYEVSNKCTLNPHQ